MALVKLEAYLKFLPTLDQTPHKNVWLDYDEEADVLYVNFKRSSIADDMIIRYADDEVVGMTILHARQRDLT